MRNLKKLSVFAMLVFASATFTGCGSAVKAVVGVGSKVVSGTGTKVAATGATKAATAGAASGATAGSIANNSGRATTNIAGNAGRTSGNSSNVINKADDILDVADVASDILSNDTKGKNPTPKNSNPANTRPSASKIGALAAAGTVAATAATTSASSNLDKNWIPSENGVYLWNPSPTEGETVEWSGNYTQDGNYKFADGFGKTTWRKNGAVTQIDEGTFKHGQREGNFKHKFVRSGKTEYSYWENGKEVVYSNLAAQTFIDYHKAITQKDFNKAYSTLTYKQKERVGDFNSYISGYTTTISSTVEDLKLIERTNDTYTYEYILVARDRWQENQVKVQKFKGEVKMFIFEGNAYIDFAKSKKIDEYIE